LNHWNYLYLTSRKIFVFVLWNPFTKMLNILSVRTSINVLLMKKKILYLTIDSYRKSFKGNMQITKRYSSLIILWVVLYASSVRTKQTHLAFCERIFLFEFYCITTMVNIIKQNRCWKLFAPSFIVLIYMLAINFSRFNLYIYGWCPVILLLCNIS